MKTDALERLISDRSYPFQLDVAAKQLELPQSTTTATPSRRLQGQLQLLDAWIIMLKLFCIRMDILQWLLMMNMFSLLELCEFVIQDGNIVSGNFALFSFISSL